MDPVSARPPITSVSDLKPDTSRQHKLEETARDLEASFLSEMLKHSGFGKARSGFGGGAGEAAFSDFLVHQYADELAKNGGIGLAEVIVTALAKKEGLEDV